MTLLWFHAFRGDTVPQQIRILEYGPAVSPRMTGTKQLELALGITPPSVYCYLGRTLTVFGDFAFALDSSVSSSGTMSPFDTGGLVRKCKPVCTWSEEKKKEFLDAYSWSTAHLSSLLLQYPGRDRDSFIRYLDPNIKPLVSGPHVVWSGRPEADIWHTDPDWRAWTWEGRWGTHLPVAGKLVAWSCPPAWWPKMLDWAENEATDDEADRFHALASTYRPGGVGALVAYLRDYQVPS